MTALNRLSLAACAALLLTACGLVDANPEDFAVDTKASPAQVMAALSDVTLEEAELLFGKVPVTRQRPGEGRIGWTVQSSDFADKPGKPGEIALRLEPLENGQSTRIHVAISVPPVRMLMGQANMVLSEQRVEAEYRKLLERMAGRLDRRSGTSGEAAEMGRLIGAVAVAANPKLQARANDLKRNPELIGLLGDDAVSADVPSADAPMDTAEPASQGGDEGTGGEGEEPETAETQEEIPA